MWKKLFLVLSACATMPIAANATSPQGFEGQSTVNRAPQGFQLDVLKSIEDINKKGYDDQMVVLQGRFTKQINRELFEFTDDKGDTIICELDDKKDWSHVKKDEKVEILAEIDKGYAQTELEVVEVRPLRK